MRYVLAVFIFIGLKFFEIGQMFVNWVKENWRHILIGVLCLVWMVVVPIFASIICVGIFNWFSSWATPYSICHSFWMLINLTVTIIVIVLYMFFPWKKFFRWIKSNWKKAKQIAGVNK